MKKLALAFLVISILAVAGVIFVLATKPKNKPSSTKAAPSTNSQKVEAKKIEIPQLSLASIFATRTDLSALDQNKLVTLLATGDVIPARGAAWPAVKGNNFNYNWEKTADYLKNSDLTLIDLEAPLTKNCPLSTSGFTFCGDARQVQGLVFAGVDIANITNNHIGNYGSGGINETTALLEKNQIGWSGFSHLEIREIKGTKFGFLGYNNVGVKLDREAVAEEVAAAKTKVDVLIVSIHWGEEYVLVPDDDGNIAPDKPIEIGHLLVASGADLVVGNHPHWVQGVELYKDKFIAYAHGNFIFDQTWSKETQEGVVGEYRFYQGKLIAVHYKPLVVDQSYQPVFVEGERAQTILQRMQDSSQQIANP